MIAVASGTQRTSQLLELGADYVVDRAANNVVENVWQFTPGAGVDLVIELVGTTWPASLSALAPERRLVFVGNAGGHIKLSSMVMMPQGYESSVTHHGEQNATASSCQGDKCLIVSLSLPHLACVVSLRDRISLRREGRQEQHLFEGFIAPPDGCSPRIDEPERRVTGVRPA